MGWTTTTSKSNLTNTKIENKSSEKFSFTLGNGSDDATVNATSNISVKTINEIELFLHVYWGIDETTDRSENFGYSSVLHAAISPRCVIETD